MKLKLSPTCTTVHNSSDTGWFGLENACQENKDTNAILLYDASLVSLLNRKKYSKIFVDRSVHRGKSPKDIRDRNLQGNEKLFQKR